MWTIGVEDFAEIGMDGLVETAQDFFGLDLEQEDLMNEVIADYDKLDNIDDDDDKDDKGEKGVIKEDDDDDDNALAALNGMYAEGARLMTLLQMKMLKTKSSKLTKQKKATDDILKILDDVLLDEMKLSKNLTAWPCESFWTVGEPGNRLELSPIISSISKAMSPNCTAPFTSCFVKKDKCEAKGDGKCK